MSAARVCRGSFGQGAMLFKLTNSFTAQPICATGQTCWFRCGQWCVMSTRYALFLEMSTSVLQIIEINESMITSGGRCGSTFVTCLQTLWFWHFIPVDKKAWNEWRTPLLNSWRNEDCLYSAMRINVSIRTASGLLKIPNTAIKRRVEFTRVRQMFQKYTTAEKSNVRSGHAK
jgi:hypothetical protein